MIEIKENEHADEKGLPICDKCNTPRYAIKPDTNEVFRCLCKCQSEEQNAKMEEEKKQQQTIKIEQKKLHSLLGKRYKNVSFENTEINADNQAIYDKVKEYAEHYVDMIDKGNGFYVYGVSGIGKTHLLACLCNYLTDRLQDCAFTSFLNIAEDIKSSFSGEQSEENIIAKYSRITFLFIDDFGKESYKKLKSEGNNGWIEEKIFEILNNRYNNMLPTIFSSNYAPEEMTSKFGFDSAIVDRIFELSTIVFKMTGRNRRIAERRNDW